MTKKEAAWFKKEFDIDNLRCTGMVDVQLTHEGKAEENLDGVLFMFSFSY